MEPSGGRPSGCEDMLSLSLLRGLSGSGRQVASKAVRSLLTVVNCLAKILTKYMWEYFKMAVVGVVKKSSKNNMATQIPAFFYLIAGLQAPLQ